MKHSLLVAAMGLSLVACSEKPPEKATTPTAPSAAPSAPSFVKPTAVRPAAIQSVASVTDGCALDYMNDRPMKDATITDKAKVTLLGWAGNVPAGSSPQQVFLEFEGPSKIYLKTAHSAKRPDVVDHFKKPGLADAGWAAYADFSEVTAGAYKVRIIQLQGQTSMVCESNHSIAIK